VPINVPNGSVIQVKPAPAPSIKLKPAQAGTVLVMPTPGPRGLRGFAGDGAQIFGEVPIGLKNGSNVDFTVANNYVRESLAVYVNGLREARDVGYTEVVPTGFQFADPPSMFDVISVDYIVA
jgi:hypothetical protein